MKRVLVIFFVVTLACIAPSLSLETPTGDIVPSMTTERTTVPTLLPQPTFTPTPYVTRDSAQTAQPALVPDAIQIFPVDLFPNDFLTINVAPFVPLNYTQTLTLTVSFPDGTLKQQAIESMGLDGAKRAQFIWTHQVPEDTAAFDLIFNLIYSESHSPTVTVTQVLTKSIDVMPVTVLPPPEPTASWVTTQTEGINIHYITGTKAERDLLILIEEVNSAYNDMTAAFGDINEEVDVYVLDRVVGQGGYASTDWVAISYPDRAYAPIDLGTLLRHELTHRLDAAIGCEQAPAFLREGLAVYMAGGHYREEPITRKASTMTSERTMIPFSTLVDTFYIHQHEVSYLDAAAFITFFIEQFGWEGLEHLCDAAVKAEGSDFEKLRAATKDVTQEEIDILIKQYHNWMERFPVLHDDSILFEYELQLMGLMRRYQKEFDPAAHFLEGILFSPEQGQRLEIIADFVRGPLSTEAITMELLLAAGQDALERNDVTFLGTVIDLLHTVLVEGHTETGVYQELLEIVNLSLNNGYEPYQVIFLGESHYTISVLDYERWPQQQELTFNWQSDRWMITSLQ